MKNLKSLLTIFIFTAILSNVAYAQDATATVNATATVAGTLTASLVSDVAFGNIAATVDAKYLQANSNDDADDGVGAGAHAGEVTISGTLGALVAVSWNSDVELSDGATTATKLTFTPTIYFDTNELVDSEDITLIDDGSGGGEATFNIGGELEGTTTAGFYSTTDGTPLTLSFYYN